MDPGGCVIIDHRDSFTYNLAQLFGAEGVPVRVLAAGASCQEALEADPPALLVLSPGPGHASEATSTVGVVQRWIGRVPLLGVCLGHQILCAALGARLVHAERSVHGRATDIVHDGRGLFAGLASPLRVARYHSWVVSHQQLPAELEICARDASGQIMAVRHTALCAHGIQFHPESFMTPAGPALARGFLREALGGPLAAREVVGG